MEKADNVNVLASNFVWSDLGTWTALYEQIKSPQAENAIVEPDNIFTYNTCNCIITAPKDTVVVTEGLDDFVVAVTDNAVLVCRKSEEQNIRQFVADVQISKGDKFV